MKEKKKGGIAKPLATAAILGGGVVGLSLLTGGPSQALTTLEFEVATAGALGSVALTAAAAGKLQKNVKELKKLQKEKELKKVI